MNIVEGLRLHLEKEKLTVKEVASVIGIPAPRIYKWLQGESSPKTDDAETLKQYLFVRKSSNGESGIEEVQTKRPVKLHFLFTEKRIYPANQEQEDAGTITTYNNSPSIILEYIDAPFIGAVEGVVEVTGDSMVPTLKPGDRLAIKQLADIKLLLWGEIYYIVDKNFQGVVRRVYEMDGGLLLMGDNEDQKKYPPVKRMWNQLEAVFKVKADITKH
jgi:phage repressor protein C with HTH and peptisase S24 domain